MIEEPAVSTPASECGAHGRTDDRGAAESRAVADRSPGAGRGARLGAARARLAARHPLADPASAHTDPRLSGDLDRRVIVICHEGYQSSLVAATLAGFGYTRAADLIGGFLAWREAALPLEIAA